ncbi:hypothetical protein [Dryocola sp. BD613]
MAVCAQAGSLVIAALLTLTLPKHCDLTPEENRKPAAGEARVAE